VAVKCEYDEYDLSILLPGVIRKEKKTKPAIMWGKWQSPFNIAFGIPIAVPFPLAVEYSYQPDSRLVRVRQRLNQETKADDRVLV